MCATGVAGDTICGQVGSEHDLRLHALWAVVAPSQARLLAILPPRRQRTIPENAGIHCSYFPRDAARESFALAAACPVVSFQASAVRRFTDESVGPSNFASSILKVTYDIDIVDESDPYLELFDEAMEGVKEGLVPGRFLVEFLPFLRHIPPWFPGAKSQRLWAKWRAAGDKLKNLPFEYAKAKLVCHTVIFVVE